MQQEHADLVVTGRIVTMDMQRRVLDDGAIAVKNGAIVAMGTAADIAKRYTAARSLGGPAAIVLPGFIEGHTHCTQCFVRSLTSNELPMIPRIYSPAQRSLDAEQAGVTVKLIAAQLLRAGVTTMCEGTLNPAHEPAIVQAIEETGIRCALARGAPDQDFHHAALYEQLRNKSWLKSAPARRKPISPIPRISCAAIPRAARV